jgi:hypothetical protein
MAAKRENKFADMSDVQKGNDLNPPGRYPHYTTVAFIVLSVIFLVFSIYLASINECPGGPDSRNNLDTARNISRGAGFNSNIVQQLFVEQPLPSPETIRPPGVAFLAGWFFRIFGISLAVQVLMNAITVLFSAWLLRQTVLLLVNNRLANLAGILIILSCSYDLISLGNNNFLVLFTVALLYLTALYTQGKISIMYLAVLLAAISAIGFMVKPTFIMSAVPAAVFLIIKGRKYPETSIKPVYKSLAVFFILLICLTSPYWIRNLILFGKLLYSPLSSLRLSEHYGGLPYGTWSTMRMDNPLTYSEIISIHGFSGLIKSELAIWLKAAKLVWKMYNPILLIVLACIIINRNKINWKLYAPALLLMIEPIFITFLFWTVETRYLWPLYPCLLYIMCLIINDTNDYATINPANRWSKRIRILAVLLIVFSLIYGAFRSQVPIRRSLFFANIPTPNWIHVVREIEPGSVVLSDDPWSVSWYSERCSVICPAGERTDLLTVLDMYKPDYYLHTGRGYGGGQPAFIGDDLDLIDKGEALCEYHLDLPVEWAFYKLKKE